MAEKWNNYSEILCLRFRTKFDFRLNWIREYRVFFVFVKFLKIFFLFFHPSLPLSFSNSKICKLIFFLVSFFWYHKNKFQAKLLLSSHFYFIRIEIKRKIKLPKKGWKRIDELSMNEWIMNYVFWSVFFFSSILWYSFINY